MRLSRYSLTVSLLICGAQASSSASFTAVYRRQSPTQESSNSIPPECNSACDPLFAFQDNCAANATSIAQCVCVPEFVVHSNACSDCVVEKPFTISNETIGGANKETLQAAVNDALEEFLDACKDELGIDLSVSNTFATETLGAVAAAAATTESLSTSRVVAAAAAPTERLPTSTSGAPKALANSAALFLVGSTLILLNI